MLDQATQHDDATVSVLTNVLSSMLPTNPMRPAIQGIILDNIDGEGLDDFKEYKPKPTADIWYCKTTQ